MLIVCYSRNPGRSPRFLFFFGHSDRFVDGSPALAAPGKQGGAVLLRKVRGFSW
jgi:hypothetical protein